MRGRKPHPTGLNKLRGNPGQRNPINVEPQPPAAIPEPPEYLDANAKAEWDRIAPQLLACSCLATVDRGSLAICCQAWSRIVKLEAIVQKTGEVLHDAKTNTFYDSPFFKSLCRTMEIYRKYAVEFGLTPSSRTRIAVEAMQPESNVLEQFIADGCKGN